MRGSINSYESYYNITSEAFNDGFRVTSYEEDQQAFAKLRSHHKPPILLLELLNQMVACPLQMQQALNNIDSTRVKSQGSE